MSRIIESPAADLQAGIARDAFVFVHGATMKASLEQFGGLSDWTAFAGSWNDLSVDTYMADGGRYRRRRHAVFAVEAGGSLRRLEHQPHYQSTDYNPIHGGIARWFEPITAGAANGESLATILKFCEAVFGGLAPQIASWKVEVHQFRIEATPGEDGRPTPEGLHRDGVDYVLVLLIDRRNIASGTTSIHAPDGRTLGNFTLTRPLDAALLEDRKVSHGVTPVAPVDPEQPAFRDVLVVTFLNKD
ncbi:MAG TPA: 2OG-Fe dioxygenase family protein [Vicinamibacterales bacterium]|nr:2OG-Fe dioxygenase family protein [Vicinamibacterales bacterium]